MLLFLVCWLVLNATLKPLLIQSAPPLPRPVQISWAVLGIVLVAFALWFAWPWHFR